jgi:regulator of protease activity HflC (stomatin/prohibitin superfamily)
MNILFGILGLIAIIGSVTFTCFKAYGSDGKVSKAPAVVGVTVGLLLITLAFSIVVIPTNYTGVKSTFGQIDKKTLDPGLNFKAPFITSVEKICNKQQDTRIDTDTEIWAETKSRTAVMYSDVTITYTISAEHSSWMVANVSNYKNGLISSSIVSSAIKTASKQLADDEATNRSIIEANTQDELQKNLNDKYKEGVVIINKVTIRNADFEESYNAAIAEKQKAQLAYEQQQIENKKAIEKAEADAEVKKKQAQGVADAAIIEAEGQKKANELLNKSLNDTIIKDKAVEKWNGELPQVMGSDGGLIVDIVDDATKNTN